MKRRIFLTLAAAAAGVLFNAPVAQAADPVKIGFLVKQPEEPCFFRCLMDTKRGLSQLLVFYYCR